MNSPRIFRLAQIWAISIIASGVVSAQSPPTVEKSFFPNPVIQGLGGTMTITLTNPNSDPTPLTASVEDTFINPPKGCLDFASTSLDSITYTPMGCGNGSISVSSGPGFTYSTGGLTASLAGGLSCSATFKVVATSFPCTNTTFAPHFSGGPDGTKAAATWTAITPNLSTFTEGGGTSNTNTLANWSVPWASGSSLLFPSGLTNQDIINGITGTTFTSVQIAGSGLVFTGNSISVDALIMNAAPGGTVSFGLGLPLPQDMVIQLIQGSMAFTGPIGLNDHNLAFIGPSSANVAGTSGGGIGDVGSGSSTFTVTAPSTSGNVTVNGPTITVTAPSTFTGSWYVLSGQVIFGTPGPQPINVSGIGKVSGTTGSYGAITLADEGVAELGSANAPATWSTAGAFAADPETEVIFNFGSNNTTHSEISSSAAVAFNGSSLIKGVFVATPSAGLTYGPLILAGTLTGCPGEAVGCGPNGAMYEAMPVCFLNEVQLKVTHIDTIFKASGENPYEGCP